MHFEVFVEDQSGEAALNILLPKLIGDNTKEVYPYGGMGDIPKGLKPKTDASKRILLDRLPKILKGMGKSQANQKKQSNFSSVIIVVCDLDSRNKREFLAELGRVLDACRPKPAAYFCLAVEEIEAWYLGDVAAIQKAYPKAKGDVLRKYVNDAICGTWETLADAVYQKGHTALSKQGWWVVGKEKSEWAKAICPHMNVEDNLSPSFQLFRDTVREIAAII